MKMRTFLGVMVTLVLCGCGTTRAQRLQIYGTVLEATGHPEFGAPLRVIGRTLEQADANADARAEGGRNLSGK